MSDRCKYYAAVLIAVTYHVEGKFYKSSKIDNDWKSCFGQNNFCWVCTNSEDREKWRTIIINFVVEYLKIFKIMKKKKTSFQQLFAYVAAYQNSKEGETYKFHFFNPFVACKLQPR